MKINQNFTKNQTNTMEIILQNHNEIKQNTQSYKNTKNLSKLQEKIIEIRKSITCHKNNKKHHSKSIKTKGLQTVLFWSIASSSVLHAVSSTPPFPFRTSRASVCTPCSEVDTGRNPEGFPTSPGLSLCSSSNNIVFLRPSSAAKRRLALTQTSKKVTNYNING